MADQASGASAQHVTPRCLEWGKAKSGITIEPGPHATDDGARQVNSEWCSKKGVVVIGSYHGSSSGHSAHAKKKVLDRLTDGLGLAGIRELDSAMAGDEFEAVMCSHVCIMYRGEGSELWATPRKCR